MEDVEVIAAVEPLLTLGENDRVVSVVIIAEYMTLDSSEPRPDSRRLVTFATDNVTPWQAMGMCAFMAAEQAAIASDGPDDGD